MDRTWTLGPHAFLASYVISVLQGHKDPSHEDGTLAQLRVHVL